MPKLSIGIPVFNGQEFLPELLDSLLAQTFRDFEILICDNESSDQTSEICGQYERRDSPHSLFPQQPESGRYRKLQPGVRALERAVVQMGCPR